MIQHWNVWWVDSCPLYVSFDAACVISLLSAKEVEKLNSKFAGREAGDITAEDRRGRECAIFNPSSESKFLDLEVVEHSSAAGRQLLLQ